ncbi:hypothetical protein RhiirB3_465622 [Rhizophagus irregularis]|nr:hypothetical protein RhiirB3_465622 [Rhizophagus irregularis]
MGIDIVGKFKLKDDIIHFIGQCKNYYGNNELIDAFKSEVIEENGKIEKSGPQKGPSSQDPSSQKDPGSQQDSDSQIHHNDKETMSRDNNVSKQQCDPTLPHKFLCLKNPSTS